MITRIAVIAVLVLAAASPLGAQAPAKKVVVISPAVLKSMTSQKTRSKKLLAVRSGLKRAPVSASAGAGKAAVPGPTSVKALRDSGRR